MGGVRKEWACKAQPLFSTECCAGMGRKQWMEQGQGWVCAPASCFADMQQVLLLREGRQVTVLPEGRQVTAAAGWLAVYFDGINCPP